MFPYDPQIALCLTSPVHTVADVIAVMQAIDALTTDGDGLKWFNQLYLHVTQAVEARVSLQAGADKPADPALLAALDVQFAGLYFSALHRALTGGTTPGCWNALFSRRNQTALARIQCAFAGMNAHINHDLPLAIVATCQAAGLVPQHGTAQYADYSAVNATLDSLIDQARHDLHMRLLGDALPPFSVPENALAAWSMAAAREAAWNNAELLWHLRGEPMLSSRFVDTLDGLTTVVGKTLLLPIPV